MVTRMPKQVWTTSLLVAVSGEAAFALALRVPQLRDFLDGQRDPMTVIGTLGMGWLVVLLAVAFGTGRSLLTAQARAARGQQALGGVASTSREWVWEADRQMRLTYSNGRVRDLLGYDPAQLYGKPLPGLLADTEQGVALSLLASSLDHKTGWSDVELLWRHADGHEVPLQGSAVPIVDATGTVVGFRGSRRAAGVAAGELRSLDAARDRLHQLLDDRGIDTALQPIIDLTTGKLAGVEALARFRDGRTPDDCFGEARKLGLSLQLDALAFRTALGAFSQLPAGVHLSVNATPELLTDTQFQQVVIESGAPLDRLVIEITEHVEIFKYDEICAALAPLRERGVRLAIDDAGAGYASFSHVLQLHPDVIKVDRSLVAGVHQDPVRRALITALVLLALELRADVTAEGVEHPDELAALLELGVDSAQGYLLARPTLNRSTWAAWWSQSWAVESSLAVARSLDLRDEPGVARSGSVVESP